MENTGYRTIGYRKDGIWILYILTFFLGIGLFVAGFYLFDPSKEARDLIDPIIFCFIGGPFLIVFSIVILIGYFSTRLCAIETDGKILLVNGEKIAFEDITDISYKKARAKNITYRFGSVIVKTRNNIYKARYIDDCESVSKNITKLKYEKKSLDIE